MTRFLVMWSYVCDADSPNNAAVAAWQAQHRLDPDFTKFETVNAETGEMKLINIESGDDMPFDENLLRKAQFLQEAAGEYRQAHTVAIRELNEALGLVNEIDYDDDIISDIDSAEDLRTKYDDPEYEG